MNKKRSKGIQPYVAAILFGALGGLALWHWGAPSGDQMREKVREAEKSELAKIPASELDETGGPARRYVTAVQEGRCEEIIAMTWWMEERLRYVRTTASKPEEVEDAHERLCATILERTPEGNQLTPEGIEEQYVFTPAAQIEILGADRGRDDLEKPVRHRTWMEVTYQTKNRALRDRSGNAIKSLIVGVNVSTDGYVLKAGVVGNLDIDLDSLSYRWTT